MDRLEKLLIIGSLISFSIIFYLTHGNEFAHGPFTYWMFVDPSEIEKVLTDSLTVPILEGRSEAVPLWIAFVRIIQNITGVHNQWLRIPSVLVFVPFIYTIFSSLPKKIRIILLPAALLGPVTAISYIFVFNKYIINISVFFVFYLLILILNESPRENWILPFAGVFSLVIFLNHYTFWPFFIIFTIVYFSLRTTRENFKLSWIKGGIIILAPIALHPRPALAFFSSLSVFVNAISTVGLSNPLEIISLVSQGTTASSTDVAMVVNQTGGPSPTWLPKVIHLLYMFPLLLLLLTWVVLNHRDLPNYMRICLRRAKSGNIYQILFIAVSVAFMITAVLYVLVGYTFRVSTFWPIVLPIFVLSIWHSYLRSSGHAGESWVGQSVVPTKKAIYSILVVSLILISSIHFLPVYPYNYVDSDLPSRASHQQVSASEYARYIEQDRKVHTDLLHKSILVTEKIHFSVFVGKAVQINESLVGLDKTSAVLFHPPDEFSGYIIVTHRGTSGLVTRGTNIPLPDITTHKAKCSRIYSNGMDSIFTRC